MARLMLYKKIHRQYLREFRVGRKFRFDGEVYKVTTKPVTTDSTIFIFRGITYNTLIDLYDGKMCYKDKVVWLN